MLLCPQPFWGFNYSKMEQARLGHDDFGISPEGLQAVAEAMANVSADSEEHHSDIWNGVTAMLHHTAAFVDVAGTEEDAVAVIASVHC